MSNHTVLELVWEFLELKINGLRFRGNSYGVRSDLSGQSLFYEVRHHNCLGLAPLMTCGDRPFGPRSCRRLLGVVLRSQSSGSKHLNKLLVLNVFIAFLVLSCSRKEPEDAEVSTRIEIDHASADWEQAIDINNLCTEVEVFPLGNNETHIIGKYGKAIAVDKRIYVLDKKNYSIAVYSDRGEFIQSISNIGDGPNAYYRIADIVENKYSGNIEILTPRGKLIVYDPRQGTFESTLILPAISVTHFAVVSEDVIAVYSDFDENRLFYYSRKDERIVQVLQQQVSNYDLIRMSHASPFFHGASGLMYMDHLLRKVFKMNEQAMEFQDDLDYGKANFWTDEIPIKVKEDVLAFGEHLNDRQLAFPTQLHYDDPAVSLFTTIYGNAVARSFILEKATRKITAVDLGIGYFVRPFAFQIGDYHYGVLIRPDYFDRVFKEHPEVLAQMTGQELTEESSMVLIRYRNCFKNL